MWAFAGGLRLEDLDSDLDLDLDQDLDLNLDMTCIGPEFAPGSGSEPGRGSGSGPGLESFFFLVMIPA